MNYQQGQPYLPVAPPVREYDQYMTWAAPRTNGMAVAALVLGIVGLFIWPCAVIAVILGHVSHGQTHRNRERGSGMAVAGIVTGYIGAVWPLLLFI